MTSLILISLVQCIALSSSEVIWFSDATGSNELSTSRTVSFGEDADRCSNNECAQIRTETPGSYIETQSIDTTRYIDITLSFDFYLSDGWNQDTIFRVYYYVDGDDGNGDYVP